MRLLRITSALLTASLILLGSCRATRDGNTYTEETAIHSTDAVLSYVAAIQSEPLPPHTYRLSLPPVSPVEDFRVELIPVLPNERVGMTSLDARFTPGEQLGELSTFYYTQGEGAMALINPPIHGLAPKPLLFGEPLLLPFRGNRELAIITNDSIRVAYRYWKALSQPLEAQPSSSAAIQVKQGYVGYLLQPPRQSKHSSTTYYIELIPSKWMLVDCNIHVLRGRFDLDLDTPGINLPYIFRSDGSTMSTRMGCPEAEQENRLIRHMGLVVLRDAGEPVTIYIPEGFTLLYRIYAPDGRMRLISSSEATE